MDFVSDGGGGALDFLPEGGGAAAGRALPSIPAAERAQGGRKPGTRPHSPGSPPHLLRAG